MDELAQLGREIEELTEVMRQLTRTMGAIGQAEIDRLSSTKKINKAMGEQIKNSQRLAEMAKRGAANIHDFVKAQESATDAIEDEAKERKEGLVYLRRNRSAFRDLAEELTSTRAVGIRFQEALFSQIHANELLQSAILLTEGFMKGLAKATATYTQAVYKGERGASASAKAMSEFTTTFGDIAQGVGLAITAFALFVPQLRLFGIAIKALRPLLIGLGTVLSALGIGAKIFGEINEMAAKQADDLTKSFRDLSEVGASGAQGMLGVFDMLQTLGMSVSQIEEFTAAVTQNAQTMRLFGANTEAGVRRFAEVAGELYTSEFGRQLELLGMTQQQQYEATLNYMSLQARAGMLEMKTSRQLAKESAVYAKELSELSKLTGATRKEQQEAREAAMAEERFRAAMIDARNRGDEAEVQRLETFLKAAQLARAAGDQAGFSGILQFAAARGPATAEATAAMMQYGLQDIESRIGAGGQLGTGDLASIMGENIRQQQQALAGVNRVVGLIPELQTSIAQSDDLQLKIASAQQEAIKQGLTLDQYLEKLVTQQTTGMEPNTRNMVDAGRNMQGAAMMLDAAVNKFGVNQQQFGMAVALHASASELFANAVEAIAEVGGISGLRVPRSGIAAPTAASGVEGGSTFGGFEVPEGFAAGGIASGPKSGYTAMLHGTEAIIPLGNNRSVPVQMPDLSIGMRQQVDLMAQQLGKLDNLVSIMKDQTTLTNKLLQANTA